MSETAKTVRLLSPQDIELEIKCGNCFGTGSYYGRCSRCGGTGWERTDFGDAVLAMCRRHLFKDYS